jgi:hypothetical protein
MGQSATSGNTTKMGTVKAIAGTKPNTHKKK